MPLLLPLSAWSRTMHTQFCVGIILRVTCVYSYKCGGDITNDVFNDGKLWSISFCRDHLCVSLRVIYFTPVYLFVTQFLRGALIRCSQMTAKKNNKRIKSVLTRPFSTQRVSMTIARQFCSQTMRQKSSMVEGRGP